MKSTGVLIALMVSMLLYSGNAFAQSDREEIIYHVVQRSFYDSNGDRIGDLVGLRDKLPYLKELGVTSILLLPLYNSVFYHNYFATDFETIDPEFGSLQDYLDLVEAVHDQGMKIYMDMETQYVTEDHIWYKDSYQNPESEFSDYIVYNGPDNTDPETIIFDLEGLNGYDGTFRRITTVNLLSPEVLNYNVRLFRNWIDPNRDGDFSDGVDGFRLDHMMDDLDWKGKWTNLFKLFWSPLISKLKETNPDLIFIAEQANWESWGGEYLSEGHVDRVFGFHLKFAIESFDKERIQRVADSTFAMVGDPRKCIVFIENHDIPRFASKVDGSAGKLKVGAALNLLIGGTPSIYYGQELGMKGDGGFGKYGISDGNDIPMREAFEWDAIAQSQGAAIWYKDSGPWWDDTSLKDHDGISLQEQRNDPNSLYNTYRKLILARKKYPALINGAYQNIDNQNPEVVSFVRYTSGQRLICLVNLSETDQEAEIAISAALTDLTSAGVVYGSGLFRLDEDVISMGLPPYGAMVVLVK